MTTFRFESLEIYESASQIGELVWQIASKWNYFERDTMGKQLVRSADSISLNLCEGYGRFFYRDKKLFYYYSRGSLYETFENLKKAHKRNLMSKEDFENLSEIIRDFGVRLNNFINNTGPVPPKKQGQNRNLPTSPAEAELFSE